MLEELIEAHVLLAGAASRDGRRTDVHPSVAHDERPGEDVLL
jgi:hypothetical protein